MTSSRPRIRLALVALVLASAPFAAAQGEGLPSAPETPLDGFGLPSAPALPPPGTELSIHEDGLVFEGRVESPSRVVVQDSEGAEAFSYAVDADGRARVQAGGETILEDATLLRLEGNPLGDDFTLVVQDAHGQVYPIRIDRAALDASALLPEDEALPAVTIPRPVDWPDAPRAVYLLFLADGAATRLGPAQLEGGAFLKPDGQHHARVQIPADENAWDRVTLEARRAGDAASMNASLALTRATEDAFVWSGAYDLAPLALRDGDAVEVQVWYERRLSPLVVERFEEPALHRFRVDGAAPTVTLAAPAQADDFRFLVSWSGADALSGLGGFVLEYKPTGDAAWLPWISTSATSAMFSGDWGASYDFRARAVDKVGNPSAATAPATTRVAAQPEAENDVNDPPVARFLTPRAGALLTGAVAITWEASDPDGTDVTSKLEISDDEGRTWRTLYAGTAKQATWDTARETEGPGYRLRLTVKDGTLAASDALSALTIRNIVLPTAPAAGGVPSAPGAPTATPPAAAPTAAQEAPLDAAADPSATEGGNKVPAPFVGLALAGAALVAARRGRR